MPIFITESLRSKPTTLRAAEVAELLLGLSTDQSPSATAGISFQIVTPNVVFAATGTSNMDTTEEVFSTGTTLRRNYGLMGPPGAVSIRAEARPGNPPSSSATVVVLAPSGAIAGARARFASVDESATGAEHRRPTPSAKASRKTAKKKASRRSGKKR
jgi:hypothetical protein